MLSVEKQTNKGLIINVESPYLIDEYWITLLYNSRKNSIRRFLWLYGSDVAGTRRNYRPLILLYGESIKSSSSFYTVNQLVNQSFNTPTDGLRLKNEVFNNEHIFNFDQREVLSYLLKANQDDLKNLEQLNLSERLSDAYQKQLITFDEFVDFYLHAQPDRLSDNLWDKVTIDDSQLLFIISQDDRLINRFAPRLADLAIKDETWQLDYDFQIRIMRALENTRNVNWDQVVNAVLTVKSDAIFEVLKQDNDQSNLVIAWMDANNYNVSKSVENKIFWEFRKSFINFLKEHDNLLSDSTCTKLFQNLNVSEINGIGYDASRWLRIYRQISDENTRLFASCVLLSFGFNNSVGNPASLVAACFSDVYYFAKAAKVTPHEWGILTVDISEEEDEDRDQFTFIFNLVNLFSPKKRDVPPWDYCELLIRTLVNKFIKYKWPNQAFLDSLQNEHLIQQAIRYALSFTKGIKFIANLFSDIQKKKIRAGNHQLSLLSEAMSQFNNS